MVLVVVVVVVVLAEMVACAAVGVGVSLAVAVAVVGSGGKLFLPVGGCCIIHWEACSAIVIRIIIIAIIRLPL